MNETKTCGDCEHWRKQPRDPHNLGAPSVGLCFERLHASPVLDQSMHVRGWVFGYPGPVPEAFPACGQFREHQGEPQEANGILRVPTQ